jgi:3D (Asp-Asp-Asp) domain-containing protein
MKFFKNFIVVLLFFCSSCKTTTSNIKYEHLPFHNGINSDMYLNSNSKTYKKELKARITVYWKNGKGSDYYTRKGMSSTNTVLKEGHVAVDPKDIPYFSEIDIPQLNKFNLKAVDTGGAVKKDTAAKKSGDKVDTTIDIFFENRKDALSWAYNNPTVVTVYVN